MKILPRSWILTMLSLLAGAAASAADLHVMQPWSRATPPGVTVGVGYVMLHNLGPRPQVIISATSPAAERVEMHETKRTPEGLTQMRPLEKPTVPPSGAFSFEPNGPHLMLVGLKAPLVTGQRVPVTLKFASGETVNFELEVRDIAATDEEHADHR